MTKCAETNTQDSGNVETVILLLFTRPILGIILRCITLEVPGTFAPSVVKVARLEMLLAFTKLDISINIYQNCKTNISI